MTTDEWLVVPLPPGVRDAALDYLFDGRVTARVRLGGRLAARVRGYNGTYRASVTVAERPIGECDCGNGGLCRHAAAVLLASIREPDSFVDLEALLAHWRGPAAEAALVKLVELTLGPHAPSSGEALLELSGATGGTDDSDTLSIESFLQSIDRIDLLRDEKKFEYFRELRLRAGRLSQRQGRTAGARALAALLAKAAGLTPRCPAEPLQLIADDLVDALAAGGLSEAALLPALVELGTAVLDATPETARLLVRAGARLHSAALDYLAAQLRAASELAKGRLSIADEPARAGLAQDLRERVATLVDFLISEGRDRQAVAAATAEARGPVGPWPLLDALIALGRPTEAIAEARLALAAASGADVPALRRRLADMHLGAGQPAEALPYLAANFQEHPTQAGFNELRAAATQAGQWDELSPEALACLRRARGTLDQNKTGR